MSKSDGGSVFYIPSKLFGEKPTPGLSIRDWFAGQVISSIFPGKDHNTAAYQAYQVADAMIKASGRNA